MRATVPLSIFTPLVFWACGTTTTTPMAADANNVPPPQDSGTADAGFAADAGAEPPADAGFAADAGAEPPADAGFAPDAAGPPPDAGVVACTYPAGAREPMTLDAVISPYSWPTAVSPAGDRRALSLESVFCNTDQGIDWSSTGHLLFVSIPAW